MKIILKLSIFILFMSSYSYSNEVKVFEFTEKELSELQVRKVRGADNKTIYTIGSNEKGNYYKAIADNAASGLGKEIKIDLNKTPIINITWKIEKDLPGIKESTKKGHDFAARVFAVKKQEQPHSQIEQLIMFFQAIVRLGLIPQALIPKSQLIMFWQPPKIILINGLQ